MYFYEKVFNSNNKEMKHIIVINVKDQKDLDSAVQEMSNIIAEKKVPVSIVYIKHGKLKYLITGNILNNHLFIQPNHHLLDKVGLKYNYQFLNVVK